MKDAMKEVKTMPEKVLSSLMKMTAAMQRMPRQEAERLAV